VIGTKIAKDIHEDGLYFCRLITNRYEAEAFEPLLIIFYAKLKEEFNDMALVPLGDRILVKRSDNDEQTTSGGIIIPDTAKEKPQEGEVVAVGSGRLLDSGDRQPVDVVVGDLILFAKYGGTEVTYDNTEYLILREDDILAKVN
jgi:chaperonin GroES